MRQLREKRDHAAFQLARRVGFISGIANQIETTTIAGKESRMDAGNDWSRNSRSRRLHDCDNHRLLMASHATKYPAICPRARLGKHEVDRRCT